MYDSCFIIRNTPVLTICFVEKNREKEKWFPATTLFVVPMAMAVSISDIIMKETC
jgi:hypothetical protein